MHERERNILLLMWQNSRFIFYYIVLPVFTIVAPWKNKFWISDCMVKSQMSGRLTYIINLSFINLSFIFLLNILQQVNNVGFVKQVLIL